MRNRKFLCRGGTDCVPQNLTRNIYASEVITLNTYPHRCNINILVSVYENTQQLPRPVLSTWNEESRSTLLHEGRLRAQNFISFNIYIGCNILHLFLSVKLCFLLIRNRLVLEILEYRTRAIGWGNKRTSERVRCVLVQVTNTIK